MTYLRGQNVTLSDDTEDLSFASPDMAKKLTSLEVRGDCCWNVYVSPGFAGESKLFAPGASNSATNMGVVFRAAGSLKKSMC